MIRRFYGIGPIVINPPEGGGGWRRFIWLFFYKKPHVSGVDIYGSMAYNEKSSFTSKETNRYNRTRIPQKGGIDFSSVYIYTTEALK